MNRELVLGAWTAWPPMPGPSQVLRRALEGMVRLVAVPDEHRRGAAAGATDRSAALDAQQSEERERELARERTLCERAKQGDRPALAELLRKHGPTLYRSVLLPRLGSEAAAQDALADTYVRVVERLGQFEWRGCGIYPWLRVIALHIAMDLLRSRRRETLFDPQDLGRELEQAERDEDVGADEQLCVARDREAARAKLERALGSINQRYAMAIRMRIVEERSREESALALGVSMPTFDVVLHRALTALRKAVAPGEEAA